jgi:hypothetical protein
MLDVKAAWASLDDIAHYVAGARTNERRMFFTTCVAGSFTGTDFCLIFAP